MDFSLCTIVEQLAKHWGSKQESSGNVMALESRLVGLRLADLGREDSS